MPSEDDLRQRLRDELTARDAVAGRSAIDPRVVIGRARRRRLPRRLALGATLGAAVVGIGVAGITGGGSIFGVAGDTVTSSAGWGEESATRGDSVAGSTDCGGTLSAADSDSASSTGLRLEPDGPVSITSADSVSASAILTNTADGAIGGTIWSTSVVVLRNDTVIGVAQDDSVSGGDDLDVGESLEVELQAQLVVCPGIEAPAPLGSPNDTVAWVVDVASYAATSFDSGGRPETRENGVIEYGPLVVEAESVLLD